MYILPGRAHTQGQVHLGLGSTLSPSGRSEWLVSRHQRLTRYPLAIIEHIREGYNIYLTKNRPHPGAGSMQTPSPTILSHSSHPPIVQIILLSYTRNSRNHLVNGVVHQIALHSSPPYTLIPRSPPCKVP